MGTRHFIIIVFIFITLALGAYQNCGEVKFSATKQAADQVQPDNGTDNPEKVQSEDPSDPTPTPPTASPSPSPVYLPSPSASPSPYVPPPLVKEPGVVTILIAMGDKDNLPNPTVDQLSARTVSENMIQYSSPVVNPKVLVVRDRNDNGESPDDYANLWQNLLVRYKPDQITEPISGLSTSDIAGYDVVWLVNPGYPMGSRKTHDTLLAFKGGVILSGDDMSRGEGFDNTDLTGLTFIDNGTTVTCGNKSYGIDNNNTQNFYQVTLDGTKFKDLNAAHLTFKYGNDIDSTKVANPKVEILAYAKASPVDCTELRPVVVRYPKAP